MIFTPWALGMTSMAGIMIWMVFRAAWPAMVLWCCYHDASSATRLHLYIEKQEILSNALLCLVLVYALLSPVLLAVMGFDFVHQIPGAMCPTGVFNANPYGFRLLLTRLTGLFPLLLWTVLYHADQKTAHLPFRFVRRVLVMGILVWIIADTLFQTLFFINLDTRSVTSCCAVLFDASRAAPPLSMGLFSRFPTMELFFLSGGGYTLLGVFSVMVKKRALAVIYGFMAPVFFFIALAGMVSCISPYIYALPHHHCPFCILTGKEALVGIPLTVAGYVGPLIAWTAGLAHLVSGNATATRTQWHWLANAVIVNGLYMGGCAAVVVVYLWPLA